MKIQEPPQRYEKKVVYGNQSVVFIGKLENAIIEVKDGNLHITADMIDFGSRTYQADKLKEYDFIRSLPFKPDDPFL